VEDNIVSIRNELLAGTASTADCNSRIIAICRLARGEKYRNLDSETLKRATFTACLQVARNKGGNSGLTGGGGPTVRQGVAGEEPAAHRPANEETGSPV